MLEDRLLQTIEKLLHEANPQSISLQVTVHQSARQLGPGGAGTIKQTYIQTADGRRFYEERIGNSRQTSYCDGKKCANVTYDRKEPDRQVSINIGHDFSTDAMFGFRAAPDPFRFYHVGLTPLAEALPGAENLGTAEVIGRACDVYHFKNVGPAGKKQQSLVYALDRETSVPLRITAYDNPDRLHADLPNWVWEAKTLDQVGDHHYPLSSLYSIYVVRDSGDGQETAKLDMTQEIHVDQIKFDSAIPQSTFWPTFQPGVKVMDALEGRIHQVGSKQEAAPGTSGPPPLPISPFSSSKAPARETTQQGTPIRVEPPGSGLWLSGVGVALSLAVLASAFVLWKRVG